MAYQTYTTDAIVVGSEDAGNADRTIILFSREAGLLFARAVSVRKEQSKLRYGLQDFSYSRVSLVRGKQGWRVVGAERTRNLYFETDERARRAALFRIVKFIRRFVQGEEPHPYLFDVISDGFETFSLCDSEDIKTAERLLTLRMLAALGYVASQGPYQHFISSEPLMRVCSDRSAEREVNTAIESALALSHL